jgi:nucleotide-binding universal stress UspA family protein
MEDVVYCDPGRLFCRAKNILLPVDGSAGAGRAATVAYEVAEMTGAKLLIIHVINMGAVNQVAMMSDSDPEAIMRKYTENGQKLLENYKSDGAEFNLDIELILDSGQPSERIVRVSNEREVDLIIMGSRGATGGAARRIGMGSATERVIQRAHCPILVIK